VNRVFIVLFFSVAGCFAQSTSSISGAVTDSSGAVIPGVAVTVTNEDTGVVNRQATTASGLFSFPALPVGAYTVTAEIKGFKTERRTKNVLVVNTPLTVDISLEVGSATEVVNVEASAAALQVENATVGNVVSQKAIVDLPLNGRNPMNLLVLEPGVVQRSANSQGSGVHVNGSRDRSSNITIDGIEANESSVPNPLSNLYRLNPDNVQEYKVTTSNATAQEGRNSGASISIATRTGTNQYHGTMFEFLRNTAFNSNEFFANAQGNGKPDIKLNQYGFELGGPIVKNKTFFFVSWAGQQINYNQPIDQTYGLPLLYTPTAVSGIFRYFAPDPNNPLTLNGQRITKNAPALVDATGNLAPGVRTCGSPTDRNCVASYNMYANDPRRIGLDPVIGKLVKGLPAPNSFAAGDGLNTGTYFWNPPTQVRGPNYMIRVDHTLNDKHTLFARYLGGDQNTLKGDPLNSRPQVYPGSPPLGEVFRGSKNAAIGLRSVISPRVINEATFGMSRFIFLFTQGEANPAFPDIPSYGRGSGTAFNNLDPGFLNTPRTFRAVTTPQIIDNLTIVKGSHVIRTGVNFRFYRHNDQRGQPGGTNVTPLTTFLSNTRALTGIEAPGIDAADSTRLLGSLNDLLGIPSRLQQVFLGDLKSDTFLPYRTGNSVSLWNVGHRLKQYNSYVQDEWRIRSNFTVNAGVRWEANPAPTEAAGRVYVPDKSITGSEGPVTFVQADRWYQNNNLGAIGPRLGITYSPNQKTVIRAGYGIAFDTVSSFQVTAVSGKVPGLTTTCSSTVGGATTPGCTAAPDKRIGEGFPNELPTPNVKPSSFLKQPLQLLTNAPTLAVFDPNLKTPTVHQWNLTIQRELPAGFLAQVGYIGNRGTRLFRGYDVNQINADGILPLFNAMKQNLATGCRPDGTNCRAGATPVPLPVGFTVPDSERAAFNSFLISTTTVNDLNQNAAGNFAGRLEQITLAARLRPNQQFNTITYLDSGGNSYYHSLQVTLRKRFSSGLMFGLAYTFAKSIDDQSVDPVGSASGGGLSTTNSRTPVDTRNWRLERARSDFDRTHVLTSNWIYELPFGKGKLIGRSATGFWNHLIGGWSLNGIFNAMSGEPFSVRSGARTSNFSHDSRATIVGEKPQSRLQEVVGSPGPVLFKDATGFRIPDPGDTGSPRNIFEGPGYWNLDSALDKRFQVTERVSLQFRSEFFNILNHANFDNARDASAGSNSILSTIFGRTCCATVAPASTQSIISTGESGRIIQFALKLQF